MSAPDPMVLVALGVGDAFSAAHYSTCFLVGAEGHWLLVDCPHPIRKVLADAMAQGDCAARGLSVDVGDLDAICLTHLHGDHASGLESHAYFDFFAHARKTRLITHPTVAEGLWPHLQGGMHQLFDADRVPQQKALDDFFDVTTLNIGEEIEVGPFRIACHPTVHHVPCVGYRISAAGRTVGISGDTAFDNDLLAWLAAADLIVHETNFGPGHTAYEDLAGLDDTLRDKMRLVHYADSFDVTASTIRCLREGDVVDV